MTTMRRKMRRRVGLEGGLLRGEGLVGNYVGVGEMGEAHGFIASVNGGMVESFSVRRSCGLMRLL